MKILHTADWHLGRNLCGVSLVEEQRYALEQLLVVVEDERPGAVLVAGDIYDRALPPLEAVELLDWVLTELTARLRIPTVLIPGNHDNAMRLGFGSRLLREHGLHFCTSLERFAEPLRFESDGEVLELFAFPYAEPAQVREVTGREDIGSHDAAMAALMEALPKRQGEAVRAVMAHAFVEGGEESDSERPLTVGGSGQVSAGHFAGIDYTALGHLHKPQPVGGKAVRYSGSLAKYSFSEEKHRKSFTIAEWKDGGPPDIREIPIQARHGLRTIQGTFDEIKGAAGKDPNREDWLRIQLMDRGPVLDAKARLEPYYPNILEISRPNLERIAEGKATGERLDSLTPLDHFKKFFKYVRDEELSQEEEALLREAVEEAQREHEEAAP